MSGVSAMEGPHNHNTNNDDKIMADIHPVLSRCRPVLLQILSFFIFVAALHGLTDEETDSEKSGDAEAGIRIQGHAFV